MSLVTVEISETDINWQITTLTYTDTVSQGMLDGA